MYRSSNVTLRFLDPAKDIFALNAENEKTEEQRRKEEAKPITGGLTEEEERELAELMDGDED